MSDICSVDFQKKLKALYKNSKKADRKLADFEYQLDHIYTEAAESGMDPIKFIEERIRDNVKEIQIDANAAMLQRDAAKRAMQQVEQFPDKVKGIESILHALPGEKYKSTVGNIESTVNSVRNTRMALILRGFKDIDGGLDRALVGEFDGWIYKLMKNEIDQADMGKVPTEAIQMYNALKKNNDLDYQQKIQVGANVKYKKGRLFKQRHNARNMEVLGKEEWVKKAKEYFDLDSLMLKIQSNPELSTKYLGKEDVIGSYLNEKYDSILSSEATRGMNISDDYTSIVFMGQKKSLEASTFFEFKDAASQMKYNMEVNGKSITSMVLEDIRDTAGYIGSARVLGPNPRLGFQNLLETYPVKSRTKLEAKFTLATGRRAGLADGMVVKSAEKIRKLADMSKLGTALFSTLPDFALGALIVSNNTGQNYFHTLGSLFKETMNNVRKEQRREVQMRLGVLLDDMLFGSMNTRIGEGGTLTNSFDNFSKAEFKKSIVDRNAGEFLRQSGNAFDRTHQLFMKYSGLPGQSEIIRTAIAKITAMGLHDMKGQSYGELYKGMRNLMERFDIGEREWDILRKQNVELEDGVKIIDVESIYELDGEAVGMSNPADIQRYKEKLATNYSSLLTFMAEHGSPTPGVKTKWWVDGFDPDTVSGQLLRFIGQYKSFSLAVVDTLKEAYGPSFDSSRFSNMGYSALSGMALAYLGTTAKNTFNGKEPPDPYDLKTWKDMAIRAGMGGIYADFLMSDYNSPWRSLPADVMGPGVGVLEDIVNAAKSPLDLLMAEDDKESRKIKRNLLKSLEANTPAIPFTKTLVNKRFFDMLHDTLNTGTVRELKL